MQTSRLSRLKLAPKYPLNNTLKSISILYYKILLDFMIFIEIHWIAGHFRAGELQFSQNKYGFIKGLLTK